MLRKSLLLSFVIIAAPSSMIDSATKGEEKDRTRDISANPVDKKNIGNIERNDEDKIDLTDQISDLFASLGANPIVDTIFDDTRDYLKKII